MSWVSWRVSLGGPLGCFNPTLLGQVAEFLHFIPQISFPPSPRFNHTRGRQTHRLTLAVRAESKQNPDFCMLTISGVSKSFGGRTLFEEVTLQVNREDRIGLVGPNGAGKSTLFSLVLGNDSPDAGKIMFDRNVTVGYLPQESAPAGNETVLELATAITPEIEKLQKLIKAWEMDHPTEIEHHDDAHARFDELGGYQLEFKAKTILAGLSFRERSEERRVGKEC